ncbi:sugar phosphate isomerase/epimerase family protein [Amycolatopsis pithecellobii]|nr:sugar phosphate isomerase/epimerase family protein [Amycolatopsis pithecellobii]
MTNTPLYSVCPLTMPDTSFEEDLDLVLASGASGIGIAEGKLRPGEDEAQLARLKTSGLKVAGGIPANLAPLPLRPPVMYPGPDDPSVRIGLMRESVERLAAFKPACIVMTTGSDAGYSKDESWSIAAEGIRDAARLAADLGTRIAVEVVRGDLGFDASFIRTLSEAGQFIDLVDEPNVGLCYDVYHVWDSPDVLHFTEQLAGRTYLVQVCDWPDPPRSLADRRIPGEGVIDLPAIFGALQRGGYAGWYELEIFSDDGRWGHDFPDSLWKLRPAELLERSQEGFDRLWQKRSR